jgi:DNA-binding beta-propeller fold protein YncE
MGTGPVPATDDDRPSPTPSPSPTPEPVWGDVVINELRSTGDDEVELYNRSAEAVDLSGWSYVDGGDHDPYVLAAGTVIAPGGFLTFDEVEHHRFGLGPDDELILRAPSGRLIDRAAWPDQQARISWCRYPDGAEAWFECARPTFGAPNELTYSNLVVPPLWVAGLGQWNQPGVRIDNPNEICFDRNGFLWAGDQANLRVQIFDRNGAYRSSVGGQGNGVGQFVYSPSSNRGPESMRADADNDVYVVDRIGDRIHVYDGDTFDALRTITPGFLVDPTGLEIDGFGHLYVADQGTNRIHKIDNQGNLIFTFQEDRPLGGSVLNRVETLAMDESRDLLFATSENSSTVEVFRLSTGQWLQRQVTERGGGLQPGRVEIAIEGIAADPGHGWFFVCDEDAGRFNVHDLSADDALFDPSVDYAFLGSFGRLGFGPGEFFSADGIFVDPVYDRIAVADQGNQRVQVMALSEVARALGL